VIALLFRPLYETQTITPPYEFAARRFPWRAGKVSNIGRTIFFHRFANVVVDVIIRSLMIRIDVKKTLASQTAAENRIEEVHASVELFRNAHHREVVDGNAAEILRLLIVKGHPTPNSRAASFWHQWSIFSSGCSRSGLRTRNQ